MADNKKHRYFLRRKIVIDKISQLVLALLFKTEVVIFFYSLGYICYQILCPGPGFHWTSIGTYTKETGNTNTDKSLQCVTLKVLANLKHYF